MDFMAALKGSETNTVTNLDKLEMLGRFAASDSLDMNLFKATTVVQLKELISCLGLGAFGCKAELINKIIVFINKIKRLNQMVNATQSRSVAATEDAKNAVEANKSTKGRLRRAGMKVKTEEEQSSDDNETRDPETNNVVTIKQQQVIVDGIRYKPSNSPVKQEQANKSKGAGTMNVVGEKIYEGSVLHEILWERVIIDEAHRIKTKSNSTSQVR